MALLAQTTVAQETIYVGSGKEIVTLTQDARGICYVDPTTATLPWDLVQVGTVVMTTAIHLQVNYIKAYAKQEFQYQITTLHLVVPLPMCPQFHV